MILKFSGNMMTHMLIIEIDWFKKLYSRASYACIVN